MTLKVVLAAAVAMILILVGGGLYTAKLLFTEDLYVSRGSFAYYVTIDSATIKDFPQLEVIGDAYYYSSCGDGPKPPANGIRYTSSEDPRILLQLIESYLVNRGFQKTDAATYGGSYKHSQSGKSLELEIMPERNGLQRVVATEYYFFS